MSDWTMEEYFAILGSLPEGKYPEEIIPEDDDSWKEIDADGEEDFWPSELQGDASHGTDRPSDIPGSHMNSLFFWGNDDEEKTTGTVEDIDFDQTMKELEEKYKIQHDYETLGDLEPFNEASIPAGDKFVITEPNEIKKPVQKLKMGGLFNEFSW
jgi:hypothetical protein